VDAAHPQNAAGAVATRAPGADGSGGSARARAAKYNMATLEERTRFKPRCEVLMVEIKVRNHKGKQGAYTADDHVRHSFLKRTALPGLRWGKVPVPGEHQRTLPDARRRVRSLSLLSLPRALCARSDQTVETVDQILAAFPLTLCPPKTMSQVNVRVCASVCVAVCVSG